MRKKEWCVDVDGNCIKVGSKVRLVGSPPSNPVVSYVPEMTSILSKEKEKLRDRVISAIYEIIDRHGKLWCYVNLSGWSWDPRNVKKISSEEPIKYPKPEIFNPENLII